MIRQRLADIFAPFLIVPEDLKKKGTSFGTPRVIFIAVDPHNQSY